MNHLFSITTYAGHRSATAASWDEALSTAQRFAAEGDLPSTIRSTFGVPSRWITWAGSAPRLMEGPGHIAPVAPATCATCGDDAEWCGR